MSKQHQQPVAYAPLPQEMHDKQPAGPSWQDVQALRSSIEAKEVQLLAAHQQLQLLSCRCRSDDGQQDGQAQDGAMVGDAGGDMHLQTERALVLAGYQCLLEEKRQLTAMMRLAGRLHDFEPGETPMRDVTCSVITHQLDTPCLSCCFQR